MSDLFVYKVDDDQLFIFFQQFKVVVKVRVVNNIQNDVYFFIVGQLVDFFGKIIGFVVNCCSIGMQCSNFFVLVDGGIDGYFQCVVQQDCGGVNFVGVVVDQNVFVRLQFIQLEDVCLDGEEGFWNGGCFVKVEVCWDW